MYDIIAKKRDGKELSSEEIEFFIRGYTAGEIPDYQASALLMAAYLRGLSFAETDALTSAVLHSGSILDLSDVPGRRFPGRGTPCGRLRRQSRHDERARIGTYGGNFG